MFINKLKKNGRGASKDDGNVAVAVHKSNSFPFGRVGGGGGGTAGGGVMGVMGGIAEGRDDAASLPPLSYGGGGRAGAVGGVGAVVVDVGPSYRDQPETDYDLGPTQLYVSIENKNWDAAIERVKSHPIEARTWISRREPHDPNSIRWRLLPLHATCVFRAPLSLIDALINAYPDGPGCVDDQGMLPIHLACRNGASRGVVMTLLNAHPRSINVKDKKGRSPLNLVENSNSQNKDIVVDAMVQFGKSLEENNLPASGTGLRSVSPALPGTLAPTKGGGGGGGNLLSNLLSPLSPSNNFNGGHRDNAVSHGEREVDYENRTVLFRLVLKKDWDGVASRVHLFPDEACTWIVTKGFNGNLRFLPIHKACVLGPPPNIVMSLISAFPEGVLRADQDGWLPLHCACFYGAPDATIDAILCANPKASQRKDDDGRLPLHYACLKGASEYVVNQLLGAHVKGALVKDNDGRMPLHHACSKGASDGVLSALVRLGPKAAQCKDANGRLPLHLACKKGISKSGLTTLLQVYPRGAAAKDDQEKLPVHHACQSGSCSPAAVLALLDAHPESIHARTAFGLTPHDEACQPKSNAELNIGSIIEVLDRFRAEQDRLGLGRDDGTGGGGIDNARVRELENRVVVLTNQTEIMQDALSDIAHIAAQLKSDLLLDGSVGSNSTALAKFCDNLMGLSQISTHQP
jgi:ankyrin repeat protein